MPSIGEVQLQDARQLMETLSLSRQEANLEIQILLQHVLQLTRTFLIAYPEHELDAELLQRYQALLQRRSQGEPIAYLLGQREFFGHLFKVSPATLIPRPDTELLVELALAALPQSPLLRLLDLGTGTGAIAISVALAAPASSVVAVDASLDALEVARENVAILRASNVELRQGDWFLAVHEHERFGVIVSNPPYIATGDAHLQQGDVRFEPRSALVSGEEGLDDLRHIIFGARSFLAPGGRLLLEHGYDQAACVRSLLSEAGYTVVESTPDLAGIERVSGGHWPGV